MSEVLSLQYNASTEMLLVEVDAVDPALGVIVGAPTPRISVSLEALAASGPDGARVVSELRDLLRALEPLARAAHDAEFDDIVADAAKLRAALGAMASEREAIEQEKHAARALVADEEERAAKLRAERESIRAERDAAKAERDALRKEAEDAKKAKKGGSDA